MTAPITLEDRLSAQIAANDVVLKEYYAGSYKFLKGYSIISCKTDEQRRGFRDAEAATEKYAEEQFWADREEEDAMRHEEWLDEQYHMRGDW